MTDKLDIYRFCLENPNTTNDKLFEIFNIEDVEERQQVITHKVSCLQMLSLLDNTKSVQSEKPFTKRNLESNDNILFFLNSNKEALVSLVKWWESQNRKGNKKVIHNIPELKGESKRHTLHMNINLLEEAKKEAEKQGVSLSKFVNCAINELLNRLSEEG